MSKFDASYQARVGLRLRPRTPEQEAVGLPAEPPDVADITTAIKEAVEAELPDYEASVTAERLDV